MLEKSPEEYPRPSALVQFFIRLRQVIFPGSQNYWRKRYAMGGNSGKGSYGKSAEFKAEILRWTGNMDILAEQMPKIVCREI